MKTKSNGQFCAGSIPWNKGKKMSDEYCQTMKQSCYWRGKRSPAWKGGQSIKDGRLFIYLPSHPLCSQTGYVRNAHLVAEKILGRFLLREEVIHHINENKLDDSVENLFLFPSRSAHCKFHGNQYQRKNIEWLKNRVILVSNL